MLRSGHDDRGPLTTRLIGEDAYRLLVENVKDYAIFMLDVHGFVCTWNAGAERIKGWRPSEILGRHFSTFYPQEDVDAGKCERELLVATADGRFEDLGWRLRKDGTRFFANVVITALRDERGVLVGFGKVTRDITERRRAEEQLLQSEERFRLLVEGVKDYAIFLLDPSGRVATWNQGAERIKGWTAAEIIGSHFSRFYPPEDVWKCAIEVEGALREGRFEDEGWRVRKDGSRFWANVVLTALKNREGEPIGFAKVTRDLTARKQAEEVRVELAAAQAAAREAEQRALEIQELVVKLEEAVRVRDDFLAIASHELKTPLHSLSLQLSTGLWLIARRDASLERVVPRLEGAQREVERLSRLIENLLDVSRVTARRLHLEPQDMDLVGAVREVLERHKEDVARSGSDVSLDAPASLPGRWDRLRVDQVVTNLLSYALKYGDKQPILLRLERVGERARIAVQDHGLGIAVEDQARIFGRYERAVPAKHHSGFGLGLWIVKQIVEALGGTISVESQLGEGSTFTVELPLG